MNPIKQQIAKEVIGNILENPDLISVDDVV